MKKTLAILLILLLTFAVTACSSQPGDSPAATAAPEAPAVGGWVLYENTDAVKLPDEAQTAFDKATEGLTGVGYTPIALIGTQVVAGINYAILCQAATVTAAPETSIKVLIIYADLEGSAEVTKIADFDIADYTQGEGKSPEQLAGGWSAPEDVTALPLPKDAQTAFDAAVKDYTGNGLTPMALLGTQVVAGSNFAILCHSTLVTENPVSQIQVATVYADLEGNSEITNLCTIDAADFNN